MPSLVTVTTDFGRRDPYVAAMKGVLLGVCPDLLVMDLTHEIAPQDVMEAALFLEAAVPYFPAGTVHLVVVDPGVGTDRRAIAASLGGQTVVCPDNGLLTLLVRALTLEDVRIIEAPGDRPVSPTFHGRDLFAPAAARLACGAPLEAMGPRPERIVELEVPEPVADGEAVRGEVIHVDRFGNLITNIRRALVAPEMAVEVADRRIEGLRLTYAEVGPGTVLALIGGTGRLEVAVRDGSAAATLGLGRGAEVVVRPTS